MQTNEPKGMGAQQVPSAPTGFYELRKDADGYERLHEVAGPPRQYHGTRDDAPQIICDFDPFKS
jgi:hypothetical protein